MTDINWDASSKIIGEEEKNVSSHLIGTLSWADVDPEQQIVHQELLSVLNPPQDSVEAAAADLSRKTKFNRND